MKSVKITPSVADIKIKIEGSTLEDFFEAGLQGISKVLKSKKTNNGWEGEEVIKKINLTSADTAVLLVNFLSEVLAYSQEERAVFSKVLFDDLDEKNIDAEIYGETVEEFGQDIKSVSQEVMNVEKNKKGNWETEITLKFN